MSESIFNNLNNIDVSSKIKQKNNLSYLPWSAAWTEVKKRYPDANYKIIPQVMDEGGNTRFWHDDGKTGWVEVEVTINGLTHTEVLAIMDFRNQAISADKITSVDANKTMKRCLTKALAMHGLAIYVYSGEELPEETTKALELKKEIAELAKKKCQLSDSAKSKVGDFCRNAEKEANPEVEDILITGDYKNINDVDILEKLKKQLLTVRK